MPVLGFSNLEVHFSALKSHFSADMPVFRDDCAKYKQTLRKYLWFINGERDLLDLLTLGFPTAVLYSRNEAFRYLCVNIIRQYLSNAWEIKECF